MNAESSMLNATLLGYVAGLAWGETPEARERNPYAHLQPESWNWEHGFKQGRDRRIECGVHDPLPPEPLKCVMIAEPNKFWQDFDRRCQGEWRK